MPSSSDALMPGAHDRSRGGMPTARPRATVLGAFVEGWRRAARAPGVVIAVWAVTTLVTLPLAATLHGAIATQLGPSTAAEAALRGWDLDWTGEMAATGGLAATLTRELLGAAGTIATLSRLLSAEPPAPSIVGAIAVYLVIWVFLSGAIIDRLARARPVGATMFIALGAGYFFRLVRLAVLAGAVYWCLFTVVHPWMFETIFDLATRDRPRESHGLAVLAGLYVVFALLLGGVSVIVDFTRVRLVVEDRRSVVASLGAGLRFVRRRFWRVAGLYVLNILGMLVLARLWLQLAVGADGADWLALFVSQLYLVARIWARMAFLGSEAVFYQGELAHAHYTAAPLPRWPDSASVEAIRNLRPGPPPGRPLHPQTDLAGCPSDPATE